jgi:putative heme-binding domain-containing protein
MSLAFRKSLLLAITAGLFLMTPLAPAVAQQGKWIWSPLEDAYKSESGSCHFRKSFNVSSAEQAEIYIAANDHFEVYINGQGIGRGSGADKPTKFNLKPFILPGANLVAVKVTNANGPPAGLVAELLWKEQGSGQWQYASTDQTWKTSLSPLPLWVRGFYNDRSWQMAKVLQDGFEGEPPVREPGENARIEVIAKNQNKSANKPVSATLNDEGKPQPTLNAPRNNEQDNSAAGASSGDKGRVASVPRDETAKPNAAGSTAKANAKTTLADNANNRKTPGSQVKVDTGESDKRFTIAEEFKVVQVADSSIGSLIAMTFDEFGRIIASREGGPLIVFEPGNSDNLSGTVYCEIVQSCQGILALNGEVYVTGIGPDGQGLYHLVDEDRDGKLEKATVLAKFTGEPGEHGPHGLTLGHDGMLYVVIGNGSQIEGEISATSPYMTHPDVDLVPRFEDPGGHAVGIKAPGGTIVRISLDGKVREIVAGGLRNAYDLVFDRSGELFVHDSDMESEEGMNWYRETSLYHVTPGADFGWRSGWAKYPKYYPDNIPPIAETGRGSPTGATCYNHFMFPLRYHNCLFLADWSEGRILSIKLVDSKDGITTKKETFLSAEQLNVTDICVGPDGGLYFCTGGRGTSGSIFRVTWRGVVPPKYSQLQSNLDRLNRQPQFQSAWARQALAKLQIDMQGEWNQTLQSIVKDKSTREEYRVRALDVMALYGPVPDMATLTMLAEAKEESVRSRVASLLGLLDQEGSRDILKKLLADDSATVRRNACLALVRLGASVTINEIERNLVATNRAEACAARRLLYAQPIDSWKDAILNSDNPTLFAQGAITLIESDPSLENAYAVLVKLIKFIDGNQMSEQVQLDLLRVTQVALGRCKVDPAKIPAFTERFAKLFPGKNGSINCELALILSYLQAENMGDAVSAYLKQSKNERADKIKVAMTFVSLVNNFSSENKLELIAFLEQVKSHPGGGSYKAFLGNASQEIGRTLDRTSALTVLENADKWPSAAIQALYIVYPKMDEQTAEILITVDRKLREKTGSDYDQLKSGIVAVLSKGGPNAEKYLQELWRDQPTRINDVVLALAQNPEGDSWNYLVASLEQLNDNSSKDVLEALSTINRRPKDPKYYRQILVIGHRLGEQGANAAVNLLEHWTAQKISVESDTWKSRLDSAEKWFKEKYPEQAPIELYKPGTSKWSIEDLLKEIKNDPGSADMGKFAFSKASCASCHRFGPDGETMGPDLTTIANRFSDREILESILYPSKVISDQYAAKSILTIDGHHYTGIVSVNRDKSLTVLTNDAKKISVKADEIDQVSPSEVSAMPADTLNQLDKREIADLIAYLKSGRIDMASQRNSTQR